MLDRDDRRAIYEISWHKVCTYKLQTRRLSDYQFQALRWLRNAKVSTKADVGEFKLCGRNNPRLSSPDRQHAVFHVLNGKNDIQATIKHYWAWHFGN